MESANRHAFKEWAAICAALGSGRQSLILRKGGIHEGRDGFRVEHPEFWLFPTNFHQSPDDLAVGFRDLWETVQSEVRPDEAISIRQYAIVDEVVEIRDESVLPRLAGLHGWSERTISQRFHYKHAGLYLLTVRVYVLGKEFRLPDSSRFAGCRSWVELPEDLSTEGLHPVLDDQTHRDRLEAIRTRVSRNA